MLYLIIHKTQINKCYHREKPEHRSATFPNEVWHGNKKHAIARFNELKRWVVCA